MTNRARCDQDISNAIIKCNFAEAQRRGQRSNRWDDKHDSDIIHVSHFDIADILANDDIEGIIAKKSLSSF